MTAFTAEVLDTNPLCLMGEASVIYTGVSPMETVVISRHALRLVSLGTALVGLINHIIRGNVVLNFKQSHQV